MIGDRYVELNRGAGEGADRVLPPGGFIPLSRTSPALDLDALIGGFNRCSGRSIRKRSTPSRRPSSPCFRVRAARSTTSSTRPRKLTSALAERDQAIGEVVKNLNIVLDTTVKHRKEFDQTVDNFEKLITGLTNQADPLAAGIANISNAAGQWPTCWPKPGSAAQGDQLPAGPPAAARRPKDQLND